MSDETTVGTTSSPSWQLPAIVIVGLLAIGGLYTGWNASTKLDSTQKAVDAQVTAVKQKVDQDVTGLKDRLAQSEKTNTELQGDLKAITKKFKINEGQLKAARAETNKLQQETSQQLSALDTSVKSELATKATSNDLKNVDTKVGGVRSDLDATREDLKMARSELGTLIARNHDEIDQLRRLGEREYVEFTIAGKDKSQKVGNVTVELRGANVKKNLYSVAVTVEDKRFEKKNQNPNEPIFFYTSGTHIPQELVVNKVAKDQISGYVSIPKANTQPQSKSSSSGS